MAAVTSSASRAVLAAAGQRPARPTRAAEMPVHPTLARDWHRSAKAAWAHQRGEGLASQLVHGHATDDATTNPTAVKNESSLLAGTEGLQPPVPDLCSADQ